MEYLDILVFIVAAVTLFLFGLQGFSREVEQLAQGPLSGFFAKATKNKYVSALTGIFATALVQSSSATSALSLSFYDAGVISLTNTLAIMIGVNIGTASTAFIVSMKVQGLGAYLLVAGSVLSILPVRARVLGKTIFYFGFILFSLDQINDSLEPLKSQAWVATFLSKADFIPFGILGGMVATALLQSSSVVIGMVILLADQSLIGIGGAISVVLGANIGTTSTALVSSAVMKRPAKILGLTNLIFNVVGVLLVWPFIPFLEELSMKMAKGSSNGLAISYSHLIFNLIIGALFLLLLKPISARVRKVINNTEK